MKKAFLVEYTIRTRVVVDVPEDYEPFSEMAPVHGLHPTTDDILIAKADDKILADAQAYIIGDNITWVAEDTEMPYDPKFDDK